jgi:hypothetical protein
MTDITVILLFFILFLFHFYVMKLLSFVLIEILIILESNSTELIILMIF